MQKEQFSRGLQVMKRPALPLAAMVNFFLVTGGFSEAQEVLDQLPSPIETDYATYENPVSLLEPYSGHFQLLLDVHRGVPLPFSVVDEAGVELDMVTAAMAIIEHRILSDELETINSILCEPCGCTLCCIGPDQSMNQDFFEIPLGGKEPDFFEVDRVETHESLQANAMDEPPLQLDGRDFYCQNEPSLVHWKRGWSLILPSESRCPNLEGASGRCMIYPDRPEVCRKPQIFPYILEPVEARHGETEVMRVRRSILAVIDCPYVRALQDEITAYAAACEVDIVFKRNKE